MDKEHCLTIVKVLGCVLEKLCKKNSSLPNANSRVTKFHASRPPNIGVQDYLDRIHQYASCSGECFILALIYIDRLIQKSNLIVTYLNVHRIIITSVTLAAKFFDDQYYNNQYYGRVGGVPCLELNSLELEFLFLTNFTLFVPPQLYLQYYGELLNHATNETSICDHCYTPDLEVKQPFVLTASLEADIVSANKIAISGDDSLDARDSEEIL